MKKQGIVQCLTRVAKVCARGGYVQCMKNAHVGQGVLNTNQGTKQVPNEET